MFVHTRLVRSLSALVFAAALLGSLSVHVVAVAQTVEVPPKDFRGSKDHPLISRFTGSVIIAYQTKDFDELPLPLGKYVRYDDTLAERFARAQRVEGKITRIAYGIQRGKSSLEIFRNYQQALNSAGFQTLFMCSGRETCGNPSDFLSTLREGLMNAGLAYDNEFNWIMSPIGDDMRHLSGVLRRPAGDVYVTVTVTLSHGQPSGALVQIVETQPMQTGQVTVDAKAIGSALATDGRIALYGLTFDTDSATVKPESASMLTEMARYLSTNPNAKVYIVGHTDSTASLAHNLDLSQRRADAVVKALTAQHGISAQRLSAKGLASYAPVASNRDEAGRAKNRRVEMVEQ